MDSTLFLVLLPSLGVADPWKQLGPHGAPHRVVVVVRQVARPVATIIKPVALGHAGVIHDFALYAKFVNRPLEFFLGFGRTGDS